MQYPKFNNIRIENSFGVSRVGDDTLILTKYAFKSKGKTILDVGTGTGFSAIYFASRGWLAEGIDISEASIDIAFKNARRNRLKIRFYQSNLFENVKKKYDLIIFNPPLGSSSHSELAKYVEKIKSLLPKSTLLFKIFMIFLKGNRAKLIKAFLKNASSHLSLKGTIALLVTEDEKKILKSFNYKYTIRSEQGKNVAILHVK